MVRYVVPEQVVGFSRSDIVARYLDPRTIIVNSRSDLIARHHVPRGVIGMKPIEHHLQISCSQISLWF